jgi:hypothetical protein
MVSVAGTWPVSSYSFNTTTNTLPRATMSSSETLRAKALNVTAADLVVELEDGSQHSAPIALYPILADGTAEERAEFQILGTGEGFYWPQLDEHISTFSIVHPEATMSIRPEATVQHIQNNRTRRRTISR